MRKVSSVQPERVQASRTDPGNSVDFQIYEKNANIGGTWLVNRYPGCAVRLLKSQPLISIWPLLLRQRHESCSMFANGRKCDIPSHAYSLNFALNVSPVRRSLDTIMLTLEA